MRDHTMMGGGMVDEDGNNVSGGYLDNEYSDGMMPPQGMQNNGLGLDLNNTGPINDSFSIIKDPLQDFQMHQQ